MKRKFTFNDTLHFNVESNFVSDGEMFQVIKYKKAETLSSIASDVIKTVNNSNATKQTVPRMFNIESDRLLENEKGYHIAFDYNTDKMQILRNECNLVDYYYTRDNVLND